MSTTQVPVSRAGSPHYAGRINNILCAIACGIVLPRPPDPIRDELAQLRSLGLDATAEILMKQRRKESPRERPEGYLFEPFEADVWGSTRSMRILGVSADEIRDWLDRHARGDHGSHAGLAANAAAIERGMGIVRSRYSAFRPVLDSPRSTQARTACQRRRCPDEWVEALSYIDPELPPFTVVVSSLDGVALAGNL
jgi:hypothetical protein